VTDLADRTVTLGIDDKTVVSEKLQLGCPWPRFGRDQNGADYTSGMRSDFPAVEPDVARAAALLADPSRVTMLLALADGRAFPAGDLARTAAVSLSTASEHLAKLTSAGLLDVQRQGRHRYFRLAGDHVGAVVEALAALVPQAPRPVPPPSRMSVDVRDARLCFGHLAGVRGVAVSGLLVARGVLGWSDSGYVVTARGWDWLAALGADAASARAARPPVRTCHVDWSERRPHVAGPFAVALARRPLEQGCLVRVRGSRAVRFTILGERWLARSKAMPADSGGHSGSG
jgi:DNA-binding transcriptional ArsR family regulator